MAVVFVAPACARDNPTGVASSVRHGGWYIRAGTVAGSLVYVKRIPDGMDAGPDATPTIATHGCNFDPSLLYVIDNTLK